MIVLRHDATMLRNRSASLAAYEEMHELIYDGEESAWSSPHNLFTALVLATILNSRRTLSTRNRANLPTRSECLGWSLHIYGDNQFAKSCM